MADDIFLTSLKVGEFGSAFSETIYKFTHAKIYQIMKQGSIATFLKAIYHDEFKWSLVKSIGMFALGIRIAQECAGLELLPSSA